MGIESRQFDSQDSEAVRLAAIHDLQDAIAVRDGAKNPIARTLRTIVVADRQLTVDSLVGTQDSNVQAESRFQNLADRLLCSESRLAQTTGIAAFAMLALGAASYEVAHEKITQIKQR